MNDVKEKEEEKSGTMMIDLGNLYKFDPGDLNIEITGKSYSNHVYIQGSDHDLYIDFLEFPGVKKEAHNMEVSGVRVYMSHIAAQKMAMAVLGLLNKMHKEGNISQFKPEKDLKMPSTTITRTQDSG